LDLRSQHENKVWVSHILYNGLFVINMNSCFKYFRFSIITWIYIVSPQGRGVHVTGVSAAYTFKLNKNILSE